MFNVTLGLIEASNLINTASIRTSDPYCRVTIGDQVQKTRVVHNTLSPRWDYRLYFNDVSINSPVRIEVRDKNLIKKDSLMGTVITDVSKIRSKPKGWWTLTSNEGIGSHGTIYIEAEFPNIDTISPQQGNIQQGSSITPQNQSMMGSTTPSSGMQGGFNNNMPISSSNAPITSSSTWVYPSTSTQSSKNYPSSGMQGGFNNNNMPISSSNAPISSSYPSSSSTYPSTSTQSSTRSDQFSPQINQGEIPIVLGVERLSVKNVPGSDFSSSSTTDTDFYQNEMVLRERELREKKEKVEMELFEKQFEKEKIESELEKERIERERLERERLERERLEKQRIEEEKLIQESLLERERLEKQKIEEERMEIERLLGRETFDKDRIHSEILESDRIEQQILESERFEKERLKKEIFELDRLLEQERLERDWMKRERMETERLLDQERTERERLKNQFKERERLEQEKLERLRLEKENLEEQLQERDRISNERLQTERTKRERIEKEKIEREKLLEQERLERERLEREKEETERILGKERFERDRLERERNQQPTVGNVPEQITEEISVIKTPLGTETIPVINSLAEEINPKDDSLSNTRNQTTVSSPGSVGYTGTNQNFGVEQNIQSSPSTMKEGHKLRKNIAENRDFSGKKTPEYEAVESNDYGEIVEEEKESDDEYDENQKESLTDVGESYPIVHKLKEMAHTVNANLKEFIGVGVGNYSSEVDRELSHIHHEKYEHPAPTVTQDEEQLNSSEKTI